MTREGIIALRGAAPVLFSEALAAIQALVDQLPTAARTLQRDTAAGRPEFEL